MICRMRKIVSIFMVCCMMSLTLFAQQIAFGGKRYDYRLSAKHFQEFKSKWEIVESPIDIYLSRSGQIAISIGGEKVSETTFTPDLVKEDMQVGFLVPIPVAWIDIKSDMDKKFVLKLFDEGWFSVDFTDKSGNLHRLMTSKDDVSTLTKQNVKNIYSLVKKESFFRMPPLPKGTVRVSQKGKDGRTWYLLKGGSSFGAQDAAGRTIIPCEYDTVIYHFNDGGWKFKDGDYRGRYESRYFTAKKDNAVASFTTKGTCVIPIEKQYTSIYLPVLAFDDEKIYWQVSNGHGYGVLDGRGTEVIPPHLSPQRGEDIRSTHSFILERTKKEEPLFFEERCGYMKKTERNDYVRTVYVGAYDWNGRCLAKPDYKRVSVFQDHVTCYLMDDEKIETVDIVYPEATRYDYNPYEELLTIIKNPN